MKKQLTLCIVFICISGSMLFSGCAAFSSIDRYSDTQIKADRDHVIVLTPAPRNVFIYDSTTAQHWERTYNHCAQIKKAVAVELGQRECRVSSRKTILLSLGGLGGLSNAIYSGIKSQPEKGVTVPLSIISGTALLTFLPSISDDDQIPLLKSKLDKLNALQSKAEQCLTNLDNKITEKALLEQDLRDATTDDKKNSLKEKIKDAVIGLDTLTATLNQSLTDWSNEAQ